MRCGSSSECSESKLSVQHREIKNVKNYSSFVLTLHIFIKILFIKNKKKNLAVLNIRKEDRAVGAGAASRYGSETLQVVTIPRLYLNFNFKKFEKIVISRFNINPELHP
jgi:hypothetical protein